MVKAVNTMETGAKWAKVERARGGRYARTHVDFVLFPLNVSTLTHSSKAFSISLVEHRYVLRKEVLADQTGQVLFLLQSCCPV